MHWSLRVAIKGAAHKTRPCLLLCAAGSGYFRARQGVCGPGLATLGQGAELTLGLRQPQDLIG